jgi:hypothetical protein
MREHEIPRKRAELVAIVVKEGVFSRPSTSLLLFAISGLLIGSCTDEDLGKVLGDPKLKINQIEATRYDFGNVPLGLTATVELELVNAGSGSLKILSVTKDSTFTSPDHEFAIALTTLDLLPGETKKITASFTPFAPMETPVETTLRIATDVDSKDAPGTPLSLGLVLLGRGIDSGLKVEPNPLDFGTILGGTTKELDVTVTNELSIAVPLLTDRAPDGSPLLSETSGPGRFVVLATVDADGSILPTGQTLAGGASTTIRVRYEAAASTDQGRDRARFQLSNCASPVCELSVSLEGASSRAALECAPAGLEFGAVNPNSVVHREVTCTNVTATTIQIAGWLLSPSSATELDVIPYDGTPATLAGGESVTIDLSYAPTAATLAAGGLSAGLLTVRTRQIDPARELDDVTVPINARAGGPDIQVSPPSLNFGQVAIGTDFTRGVLVANAGRSALHISGIALTDSGNGFSFDVNGETIQPGASTVIDVHFEPTVIGEVMTRLRIGSDDADSEEVFVDLRAEGVSLPPCSYTARPTDLSFGLVPVETLVNQGVLLTNTGTDRCLFRSFEIHDLSGPAGAFSVASGQVDEFFLAPGESKSVIVELVPGAIGSHTASLEYYVSDPNYSGGIPLRGVGIDEGLLVSPRELDFGVVQPGCATRALTVDMYNVLSAPVTVERIIIDSLTTEFALLNLPSGIPAPPGAVMAPGDTETFEVQYQPTDLGTDVGHGEIYVTGQTEPYVVSLFGRATPDGLNEERFKQAESALVDVLFVVDNSCSMGDNQANLVANFTSFIRYADAQALDYRIAVVTTDADGFAGSTFGCPNPLVPNRPAGTGQGSCGYFADGSQITSVMDPNWRIITPDEAPSTEEAFTAIANQGTVGSGDEKEFEAAYMALSAPIINGWNAGFLRNEASLAIIMVGDEREDSLQSVDFYVNFFLSIKGARNRDRFSASVIGSSQDQSCPSQDGLDPIRLHQMVARTGGVFESICSADWSVTLENLGLAVFGYRASFLLTSQPVPGSIVVEVDGVRVDAMGPQGQLRWGFDAENNSVNFGTNAIPEPGSDIVIRYASSCL